MYKVVVVDDHPFIRATVCMLLRKERLDVVGQADNGIDAVRLARELAPDLVILPTRRQASTVPLTCVIDIS